MYEDCGLYEQCWVLSTPRSGKLVGYSVLTETTLVERPLVGMTECIGSTAPLSALSPTSKWTC